MNPIETYALMARCLKGEGSPDEDRHLSELLFADPVLRREYELLKKTLSPRKISREDKSIYTKEHLQTKFDSLTKKLKDEGAL